VSFYIGMGQLLAQSQLWLLIRLLYRGIPSVAHTKCGPITLAALRYAQNSLATFPRSFPVDEEVANYM